MHLKVLKFHCLNICYYTFRTIEKKMKRITLIFQKGYHIIVVTLDFTHELSLEQQKKGVDRGLEKRINRGRRGWRGSKDTPRSSPLNIIDDI